MSKDIRVAKAFQSTDRDTKEPQVVNTKGGEMHKYMVQFEGRSDWIGLLKKPGNEVKQGDVLFGDIIEDGQWGKPEFKKGERPFGSEAQAPAKTTQSTSSNTDMQEIKDMLTYQSSLIENFLQRIEGGSPSQAAPQDTGDDVKVDLSELPY